MLTPFLLRHNGLRGWRIVFFPGWLRYFQPCQDFFRYLIFFPATSWIWSKFRSRPCIKALIQVSQPNIKFWYTARTENIMVISKNSLLGQIDLRPALGKCSLFKTDFETNIYTDRVKLGRSEIDVDLTKNHSSSNSVRLMQLGTFGCIIK